MRFYTQQPPFYCGIDLHARTMYLCILDQAGETLLHRNMTATPEALLKAIAPYREQIVLAAACLFTWYWLADLWAEQGTGLWRFFAVLRWFTQETLQDGKIIAQFGRLLAGRL